MKHFNISIILLLIALTITNRSSALDEHPVLEGPYLGQKPPGLIPDAFAPGIVSTENYELTGVFTPNMKEFYLIRDGGKYEKPSLVYLKMKITDGASQLYLTEWGLQLSLQMARLCI